MTKSLIYSLISLLIITPVYALDKCKAVKKIEVRLSQDIESLQLMRKIHRDQLQAKEIQERVLHGEDVRELGVLAEAIEEEVLGLENIQQKESIGFAVSTGSFIVASYIFKKLNADTAGQALKTRLFRAVVPGEGRRLKKYGVNSVLLITLASSFYLAYQWNENRQQKNFLKDMVVKLNSIRDLSEDIITLKNKIENDTVDFQLKVEELEDEGILEIRDEKINCL